MGYMRPDLKNTKTKQSSLFPFSVVRERTGEIRSGKGKQRPRTKKGRTHGGTGRQHGKQRGCCIHSQSLQDAGTREKKINCIQQIMSVVRTAQPHSLECLPTDVKTHSSLRTQEFVVATSNPNNKSSQTCFYNISSSSSASVSLSRRYLNFMHTTLQQPEHILSSPHITGSLLHSCLLFCHYFQGYLVRLNFQNSSVTGGH